jgi:hypothetical protein
MLAAIHQPNYIPWLGFFHKILSCDLFVFLDNVEYNRKGWCNRCKIPEREQGWKWLTVPVLHKGQNHQTIQEARINPDIPWSRKHLTRLRYQYHRATYFQRYMPPLEEILGRSWTHLADLNMALIQWIARELGAHCRFEISSQMNAEGKATERLISILLRAGARRYLSGVGIRPFQDEDAFRREGIDLIYQDFTHPVYPQARENFEPNMSVLDLLFWQGPESRRYIV